MEHGFDQEYWQQHWREAEGHGAGQANPHLVREVGDLSPGTALEAGCGEGAEARWLAARGWRVTAVDISAEALDRAARRPDGDAVTWVEADLASWEPPAAYDLVTTHYAHATIPQLDLYERLAGWVAPGGTLLVVGHERGHGHGGGHPPEAAVTVDAVVARLDPTTWEVVTAEQRSRAFRRGDGSEGTLDDVVVRAVRR